MRKRLGFVSNSSSSSFICDVCGGVEGGYDVCLDDVDMSCCIRDHDFHNHCNDIEVDENRFKEVTINYIKDLINRNKKLIEKYPDKDYYKDYIKDFENDLKKIELSEEFNTDFYDSYFEDGIPSEFCPICSLNVIRDSDTIKYMYKKFNTTKENITNEIRNKFKNLKELEQFVK